MPNNYEKIKEQVIYQNDRRPVWNEHDTPENLAAYIKDENIELLAAIELDEPAFAVASELGDVEYLCIKYEHAEGELPDELRYIRYWAWKLAEYLGLNMADCVHMKIVRNDLKYPSSIVNNYPYEQGRAMSKKLWSEAGGDAAFSHWFLEVFGDEA